MDLDAIVKLDEKGEIILGPSAYAELVLYMTEKRRAMNVSPLRWIVVMNRLPHVDSKVTQSVAKILEMLAPRLDFRLAQPIHDRIMFREMFLQGLTVFDKPRRHLLGLKGRAVSRGLKEVEQLIELAVEEQPTFSRPAPQTLAVS